MYVKIINKQDKQLMLVENIDKSELMGIFIKANH
jgi:hypothetical protein